jgi:Glycosyltransferase family 87
MDLLRWNLERWWRIVCPATIGAAVTFWGLRIWAHYSQVGLFRWLGSDYGIYFAQSAVLWSGNPQAIYDRQTLHQYHQRLTVYTSDPTRPLLSGPVPYPPLFAWLFTPFTLPPPPIGFALWTGLNFLAALYLARRVATLFPKQERMWVFLLLLTAFPMVQTLVVGQPMILLAYALAESYLCLRAGREFCAGLWLACVLFKPQYGILLGPLLIWKRRWATVAGALLGAAVIVAGSVVVAGVSALLSYPASLPEIGDFRGIFDPTFPRQMINWRSLVLFFLPRIASPPGIQLTLLLGAVTVLVIVLAWRGPWAPRDRLFPAKMSLLLVATLLANYHSHLHGAVLLAMPLAAVLAERQPSRFTRMTIVAGVVLPTVMLAGVVLAPGILAIGPLFALLLLVCFSSLLAEVWSAQRTREYSPAAV